MEDTDTPLFLRYINLLMNDAIFLLDEALSVSTHIRDSFLPALVNSTMVFRDFKSLAIESDFQLRYS